MMQIKRISLSRFFKLSSALFFGSLLSLITAPPAAAHLMVAQHGTINIVGSGAFLVISLPVSAFANVDDDGDFKLSRAEFTKHRPALVKSVNEKIKLLEKGIPRPLEGMMLSPVSPHENPMAPADQLVIMGRFPLVSTATSDLTFHLGLFGQAAMEQQQKLSFSNKEKLLKHKVVLTPERPRVDFFSSLKTRKDSGTAASIKTPLSLHN